MTCPDCPHDALDMGPRGLPDGTWIVGSDGVARQIRSDLPAWLAVSVIVAAAATTFCGVVYILGALHV